MSNLQRRRRSDVWSPTLPASKAGTIYAPACFFTLWTRSDEALKRQINRLLLEMTTKAASKSRVQEMTADDL